MLQIATEWKIEQYVSVLKIMAIAKLSGINGIDNQIKDSLIGKMASIIEESERFNGKALELENIPDMPIAKENFVVCTSISFSLSKNMEAFKEEFPKILKQG